MERNSHHPPCGSGRLLRLGRAAARPVAARQADRRWRRAWCSPPRTKPRRSGFAAACRDGGRASSVRSSFSSAAISRTTSGWATPRSRCSAISRRSSSGSRSTRPLPMSRARTHLFGPPAEIAKAIRRRVRAELGLPISVGVARTKHLAKIASQVAKPDGLVVVDPATELDFLHDLPVELMWGVGPVTKARLAEVGVLTIGQLAKTSPVVAGAAARPAAGREAGGAGVEPRSARNQDASAGAFGRRTVGDRQEARRRASFPADAASSRRPDRHPAPGQIAARPDRDGAGALCRSPLGHPLRHAARADFGDGDPCRDRRGSGARRARQITPTSRTISLLAISVSNLEEHVVMQLELPLGLEDEERRPGSKKGTARWVGRPRRRHDPRSLRMGGGRLRVGRAGDLPFRPRRIPRARRTGAMTIAANTSSLAADSCGRQNCAHIKCDNRNYRVISRDSTNEGSRVSNSAANPLRAPIRRPKFRCGQASANSAMLLICRIFSKFWRRLLGARRGFSLLSGKTAFAVARRQNGQMYTPRMPPSG